MHQTNPFTICLKEKVRISCPATVTSRTVLQTWTMKLQNCPASYPPMSQRVCTNIFLSCICLFAFFPLKRWISSLHVSWCKHGQCHRIILNTLLCLKGTYHRIFVPSFFFFFLSEKVNLITACTLTQTWAMSKNSSEYAPMSQRYLPFKKKYFFFLSHWKGDISSMYVHWCKHGQCHRIVLNTLSCLIGKY